MANIKWFKEISMNDVASVGGKNASLGEMIQNLSKLDLNIPNGFATTAQAFNDFIELNQLTDGITKILSNLDVSDTQSLLKAGETIRQRILQGQFSQEFITDVKNAYEKLLEDEGGQITVAVRSSATAEDLPEASFAGQQETFLNVQGIEAVLSAIKKVFASLYNDRAIAYRVHHQFRHHDVALSVGIQRMVRSDLATSGVVFTVDTESGFDKAILVTATYGLGETIVQGSVNPDEFYVFKPAIIKKQNAILKRNLGSKAIKMIFSKEADKSTVTTVDVSDDLKLQFCLNDEEVQTLAQYALAIEGHYGRPMDIEWAKDGLNNKIYIVQARPETVQSRVSAQIKERYILKDSAKVLIKGRSIGQKIGKGQAKFLKSVGEMHHLNEGDVLITDMTDPDWEPIMQKAAAIVTNRGGRTCHAAIIARELGIPAVVGTGNATEVIKDGAEVTVCCAQGEEGYIYEGLLDYKVLKVELNALPELPFKIALNVGNPDRAFGFQFLPNHGVGLARLEFIINHMIGIHPKAILNYADLNSDLQNTIAAKTKAYGTAKEYYIERLKEGIAMIGSAFYDKPVIVRLSDFKSNEYANLLGGELYELDEENPMLGFRGASRYIDKDFRDCFYLECEALKRVRNEMGLTNVQIMVPFVRTVAEAQQVINLLSENGLKRGENGLKIIMMCEIPANAVLADEFLQYFDGFSIGSNDMTQLTLGLDRDSAVIAHLFDERNQAVKAMLSMAIRACRKQNKYVGICGQGPSDHPDFAKWLMEEGIESVSLNPDSVIDTWFFLANNES